MIGGMYIFGKILVAKILLNPVKQGIIIPFSASMLLNFKLLASILYMTFLEYLAQLTKSYVREKEGPGADGIS